MDIMFPNRRAVLWVCLVSCLLFALPVAATGNFTISASPASLTIAQGTHGTSTITTTISGGFNNSISLSASGMPAGVAVSFNPPTIQAPGAGNSTMAITVLPIAKQGTYPITVTGNGGGIKQTTTVTLTVVGALNFALSASPPSLTIAQGTQGISTITTTISGGFNSSISLSASGMPAGVAVSFNPPTIPAPGAGNSTMTIMVSPITKRGTYPITVTGNGGGIKQTTTVTLTVISLSNLNFAIGGSPSSLSIAEGNQGTVTITTFALLQFNNPISLTAAGAPSGATVSLNPATIPAPGSGNSTMTITVGKSTSTGIYPLTVTGNGGGIQRSTTVTLTVTGGQPPTNAKFMEPYSYALQSSFGRPPYTYKLTSGSLPSGLAMNGSGDITGKASAVGQFPFQVLATDSSQPPQQQSSNYTLDVVIGLDTYGGLTAAPVPGCTPTGYFQVVKTKVGNNPARWVYADPQCNAFFQLSIYEATSSFILSGILQSHYGNDNSKWAKHALQRELAYGFNSNDIFYFDYVLPIPEGGNGSGASIKMPFQLFFGANQHAMFNPGEVGLPEAIKNLVAGQDNNGYYNKYGLTNMDIMDPNWPVANKGELALLLSPAQFFDGFNTTPWIVAISLGDADEFVLFKGTGPGGYAHPSMVVAASAFNYNLPPVNGNWQRPILYSKAAWTCNAVANDPTNFPPGQSYLEKKYGTIATLNRAWGTGNFYTSFCDAGGFGTGTGVLDEDGRHTAWFGNDYFNQSGMNSNLLADLNAYLRIMSLQLYAPQISVVRGYDPNHLMMCGFFGGVGDFGMRPIVAKALSDQGCQVLVLQWNSEFISQALANNRAVYDITGLPITVYQQSTAQRDSDESDYPYNGAAYADYATQLLRGQHYGIDTQNIYGAQGTNTDYYDAGVALWALTDNSGENRNWGFISLSDNVYDAKCAVRAASIDQWGYACGGEAADYGDYTDGLSQANSAVLQQLIRELLQ